VPVRCLLVLALALPAVAAARPADPLAALHPTAAELPGLRPLPGSARRAAGEGLTAIYDGGYRAYLDRGVALASQASYEHQGAVVEVVVHRCRSARAARGLLGWLCGQAGARPEPGPRGASRCVGSSGGAAWGYWGAGTIVASVVPDRDQPALCRAFLDAIARRAQGRR
jgi:hypothetical protein